MGCVPNMISPCADDKWCLPFDDIPHSLQVYANGDVKIGFVCYNMLAATLLTEICPDPEVTSYLTGCSQFECLEWWCCWLKKALMGVMTHIPATDTATTREELLQGLRLPTPGRQDVPECPTQGTDTDTDALRITHSDKRCHQIPSPCH